MTDHANTPPTYAVGPILLSRRDAARALAISPRQLDLMTAREEIRCRRIGRRVLYTPDDLRAFADSLAGQPEGGQP